MTDLKEELQKAFSKILGEEIKGDFSSSADVVAEFNRLFDLKHQTKEDRADKKSKMLD